MKVLFIGVYRDGTGWGNAARDYILALDAAGVEVVPRAFKLNGVDAEVPSRIEELEKQSPRGCDVAIQCVLPHHMDYSGEIGRNIGLYFSETSHFRNTSWPERLSLMDEVWVACNSQVRAALDSNVTVPIGLVPCATDITKYEQEYDPLPIPDLQNNFVFYHIGELTRRKNLTTAIKAFHLEFRNNEPVQFVIKGGMPGMSPADAERHIREMCRQMKAGLKLYPSEGDYKPEIIITNRMSEHDLMRLHASCDCFLMPSYGEGWCLPAFDAMAMGKTPIVTDHTGMVDFISWEEWEEGNRALYEGGWVVRSRAEPVFGMNNETFPDLFVGNEDWYSIDVNGLRKAMREAFENSKERERRAENGMNRAYDFSYENIGQMMVKRLNGDLSPYYGSNGRSVYSMGFISDVKVSV